MSEQCRKIESNPIQHIPLLKEDNIREIVLTDEEFEKLLECAPEHIKPLIRVAFYEPMRKMEIVELTWNEVDLSTDPGFIRLGANRTKGKKQGRSIPLHPRLREMLLALPSRFKKGRVFLKDGMPFVDFKDAWSIARKNAGLELFVFHDLSHCAATNLRKAGNDYSTIMKAGGWKTMPMFLRYNLVDETDLAEMKWKGEKKESKKDLEKRLTAAGFDVEEIKKLLFNEYQKYEKNAG